MEEKLVIWICDDDPVFLNFLDRLIRKMWKCPTRRFVSAETLYDTLETVEKLPDCVFLDIVFSLGTSLKVGARIREHFPSVRIIYLTGYNQYLPEVFEADPVYFLEKPVDANKLQAAFAAVRRSERPKSESDMLTIQQGKTYLRIPVSEIDCIESNGRRLRAWYGEKAEVWNGRLDEVHKQLPAGLFARPHRSYLVNMNRIQRLESDRIFLFSGREVPIAQRRVREFRQTFAWFSGADPTELV